MNYKNGYKVVYDVAAGGERTFYASKSSIYPNADDTKLASFKDAEYAGKTIYEYEGEFYVADTTAAKFDKEGKPTGSKIEGFEKILVEDTDTNEPAPANIEEPKAPVASEPEKDPEVNSGEGTSDEQEDVE